MGEIDDAPIEEIRVFQASEHYRRFMEALGLPLNEETEGTPMRVARMLHEEFSSFLRKPPQVCAFDKTRFKTNGYDQYVVVKGIRFFSLCEHHMLPFDGVVHVGYHPGDFLAGLSKIPRVVRYFAGRPQLQERLVMQIAEYLFEQLQPHGAMVVAQAAHSCLRCRGVRDPESETVTSKLIETEDGRIDKHEMLILMGVGR